MKRHATFESISECPEIQEALRDLYDHPDKVELYPGIFCEGDAAKNLDPGPREKDLALWAAIFSDAITLVRSDRFYTVVSFAYAPRSIRCLYFPGLEHQLSHFLGHEGSDAR